MKKKTNAELDLSDSLIDLCCCALGGFVLLLVLVIPEPTKPPAPDTLPIKRTVEFEFSIPVLAGEAQDAPDQISADDRLVPSISMGSCQLKLEIGGEDIPIPPLPATATLPNAVKSECSLGIVEIGFERKQTIGDWVSGANWGTGPQRSHLICKIAISNDPAQEWESSLDFMFTANVTSPKSKWPKEIDTDNTNGFWSSIKAIVNANGDVGPSSQTNRAFPSLIIKLMPERAKQQISMPAIPWFFRRSDGFEYIGAFNLDENAYWNSGLTPPEIPDQWTILENQPATGQYDWRIPNIKTFEKTAMQSMTFVLRWNGSVKFPEPDDPDAFAPSLSLSFSCD